KPGNALPFEGQNLVPDKGVLLGFERVYLSIPPLKGGGAGVAIASPRMKHGSVQEDPLHPVSGDLLDHADRPIPEGRVDAGIAAASVGNGDDLPAAVPLEPFGMKRHQLPAEPVDIEIYDIQAPPPQVVLSIL